MELLSPARGREKSPLKDITNSTPTPGALRLNSPRKITKPRLKRSNSSTTTPHRRSTRLSSLRSDTTSTEEKPEESQTIITTRSRRKGTPSEGSVTVKKRGVRSAGQDGSVSGRGRKRRSMSTCPSSPLAEKGSPMKDLVTPMVSRPRMTRSASMSAKSEESLTRSCFRDIPVITESTIETDEAPVSPLRKYDNNQQSDHLLANPTPSPFKTYPLPFSPAKPLNLASMTTPRIHRSPLIAPSSLRAIHWENNLFAISPGMFPQKTKRVDYLDVLADADRRDFMSPLKTVALPREVAHEELPLMDSPVEELHNLVLAPSNATEETILDELQEITEDHPHLALLNYLADVASVRDHLPQSCTPPEEILPQGTIEDILTAAALAESMKDEIFNSPVGRHSTDVISEQEEDDQDVEIDIITVDEKQIEEIQESIPEENVYLPDSQVIAEMEKANAEEREDTLKSVICISNNAVEQLVVIGGQVDEVPRGEVNAPPIEDNRMDDLDSLISFSEAEDNDAQNLNEHQSHTVNLDELQVEENLQPLEHSTASTEPNETPAVTVGVNEIGEFDAGRVEVFEDAAPAEEDNTRKDVNRLSMDGNVILKFAFDQKIVRSPPKRHNSALSEPDDIATKKRKTGPVLPNTTRLDILRKRAKRVRSREARHNIKRRDITSALQPILDNLPSPPSKVSTLRDTPALIPPSLKAKRLQSPVTPAPTKRRAVGDTPLTRLHPKQSPLRNATHSPKKHIVVRPSPVKDTPRGGFEFVFDKKVKEEKENVEPAVKPTARYEVYSKIFGPPPQISKPLVDKEITTTLKLNDTLTLTQPLDTDQQRFKSPLRKLKQDPTDPRIASTKKKPTSIDSATPTLGRPVRNESFAVPSVPQPPGPPQLPPSSIQRNPAKRGISQGPGILPSPAQGSGSGVRSALPRPAGTFGSALPVPATRRSTRVPKVANESAAGVKSVTTNVSSAVQTANVGVSEKKVVGLSALEASIVEKNLPVAPAAVSVSSENVTMERPKGKLGGAQRVNRNGDTKKVEVTNRPTRPPTPPLTSLSQKELKSLTDANTKKNEGFKTVNLQPSVKRVNKKRPGDPSDDFMIGKGAKWSKEEALPDWDRNVPDDGKVRWKSPRFMAKTERRGALRVKGILKKKERERLEKEEETIGVQIEPLIIQRFVYKGEKL